MNATRRQVYWLVLCVLIIGVSSFLSYQIERDWGKVDVQKVHIAHPTGKILVGKLYRPVAATPENKLPAVLCLHGYQNDKDTQNAFAIELSRRGFVTLALDQLGHGSSGGSLAMRGADATLGGDVAYKYLKSLPFVDGDNLGVMGHSMGAGTTLAVGAANPDHRALNPQCGRPGTPDLHNVLLTQALYEEFGIFRENEGRVEHLTSHPARIEAFGLTAPYEWNTTYGDFALGTARRAALIPTVHPGVTHNPKAVAEALDWMRLALKGGKEDALWIPPTQQVFMWHEWLTLIALVTTILSLMPLSKILLSCNFFTGVAQPMPQRYAATGRNWWILALINTFIAGITYPPITTLGGLTDKLRAVIPWFRLPMGNGVALWFVGNALIYIVLFLVWYNTSGKKAGVTMYDMGVSFDEKRFVLNWGLLGKTLLLGGILFSWMYILQGIAEWAGGVEFRFFWPFMRQFTPERFLLFWLYLIPALLFFLLNGGMFLFGQARQKEYASPVRTQWMWWLRILFAALFGLFLVWCIQYVPYLFLGMPPGFEALGLPFYGQMWPLMLFIFIPEFALLLFMGVWFFRHTGRVYLGALMMASLAIWFTTAGSVLGG